MNKLLSILIILTLTISLVHAQEVDGEQFKFYQLYLEENQMLSQEIIDDLENLSPEQREEILSYIDKDSTDFWNQWSNGDLTGQQKRDLLRDIPVEKRNQFMKDYGQQFGVELNNMGEESILFGDNNVIGNSRGYFQMDMIDQYNKNNPDNPITSIGYQISKTGSSMIFTKKDGSSLDLTVADSERGFYFDPDSGKIRRVNSEGVVDPNDPFSGVLNGKGSVTITATKDKTTIKFDFTRDGDGKALGKAEFPKFTNSKGESYSTFQHPSGKGEDGETQYDLIGGELTFDKDGKLIKMHNMYKDKGDDSWGGFFGEDTTVTYNEEAFEAAEGSKVMFDLEKGEIKAEVKRTQVGPAADAKEYLEGLKTDMGRKSSDLAKTSKEAAEGQKRLVEARKVLEETQKEFDKLSSYEKLNPFNELVRKRIAASGTISAVESIVKKSIVEKLGLDPNNPKSFDNPLVKAFSSEIGLGLTSVALGYVGDKIGAAGDIAATLSSFSGSISSPVLASFNPAEGTRMDIELSNQVAKGTKKITTYAGTLRVADSSGRLSLVSRATSHGYYGVINTQQGQFEGINFILQNNNYPGGQSIKVSSQNGGLRSIGLGGLEPLKSAHGPLVGYAGGGVSVHYDALGALDPLGLFRGTKTEGEYRNVLTADYQVATTSAERAAQFETSANAEYRDLYYKYRDNVDKSGSNVWTQSEIAELNAMRNEHFVEYNRILNSGDTLLTVESDEISKMLSNLGGHSGGLDFDPVSERIIDEIGHNAFTSDPVALGMARERGIVIGSNPTEIKQQIKTFADAELGRIFDHIRSHPGTITYTQDASNGFYQITSGGASIRIDPIAAPIIGNVLPVIAGHGTFVENQPISLNLEHTRFGNTLQIYLSEQYQARGLSQIRALKDSQQEIKTGLKSKVTSEFLKKLSDPASRSDNTFQVYPSSYSSESGTCSRCGKVHSNTRRSYSRGYRRWGGRGYRRNR